MKLIKYLLIFFYCNFLSATNFDFITNYEIDKLHEAGLKGNNYSIGILEQDPILHNSIASGKLGYKFGPTKSLKKYNMEWDYKHPNHVAGILAGKPKYTKGFKGGVAPESYILQASIKTYIKDLNNDYFNNLTDNIIDALECLAFYNKIINISGSIVDNIRIFGVRNTNKFYELSTEQIERIKKILILNNSVLIITASNKNNVNFHDKSTSTYAILQLLEAGLEEHILIVANLEYDSDNKFKAKSMTAGENNIVQRNFIAACGTNILSASNEHFEYRIDTGSSMAAPIVTGVAVLLHEYLSKTNPDISFMDIIKIIKENAQKKDSKIFGRGILNTKKLFTEIIE